MCTIIYTYMILLRIYSSKSVISGTIFLTQEINIPFLLTTYSNEK